jgi:hypothetical protein
MSSKYNLEFRKIKDAYQLNNRIIKEIELLIDLLCSNVDWDKDPLEFVFRKTPAHPFPIAKPFNFNAENILRPMIGIKRNLSKNENLLCQRLQSIIDQCEDEKQIRKAFGTLFERFVYRKKSKGQKDVVLNCHLYVQNKRIENEGVGSIDIGIDRLDDKEFLEMTECGISIRTFERKSLQQLNFYPMAFGCVRAVAPKAKLYLCLISARSDGKRNWNGVLLDGKSLTNNNIKVHTDCLLDRGVDSEWNN